MQNCIACVLVTYPVATRHQLLLLRLHLLHLRLLHLLGLQLEGAPVVGRVPQQELVHHHTLVVVV